MFSAAIRFVGSNIDQNTWESDGTYSFGYKSANSERNEASDKNGIVTGSYVTLDASGQPMTVRLIQFLLPIYSKFNYMLTI